MKIRAHNKSGLFLLEIILNFLFFMLTAVICLQMYVKSHQLSETSAQLEQAVTTCNSVASICKSNTDSVSALKEIYPYAVTKKNLVTLYLDQEFHVCKADNSYSYRIKADIPTSSNDPIQIACYKTGSDSPVYTIKASAFHPRTLGSLAGGDRP
jgi:hypothetical protein